MQPDHHHAHQQIGAGHQWHKRTGDSADAVDAAEYHRADQDHQHAAAERGRHTVGVVQHLGNRVGLHRVGNPETGETAEDREGESQPVPAPGQAVADVVHGAAAEIAVAVALAKMHGTNGFGILRGHAAQRGYPHPEQRPRAAQGNGGGHPGDVPRADGGRERGHQRAER